MSTTQTVDFTPILNAFGLSGCPQPLDGGTTQTFHVENVVLKLIKETSLENNHSPELAAWIAEFSASIPQTGVRLPQPRKTKDQVYITSDGWTAISYLPGQHARSEDIPDCIQAVQAYHQAIAAVSKHPYMDDNRTAWGYAHHHCWNEAPTTLQPQLEPLVNALYALRQPVPTAPWQVIHGDLNPGNFLITPGLPPAILDFSPFWGPPEFALAIMANFFGPRRKDLSVLRHFEHIPHFHQLLLRAAIRMLLVVSALNGLEGWEQSEEKRAAEQVLRYVKMA